MVESLFRRAKEFIGLEGDEEESQPQQQVVRQMDIGTILRNKKAKAEEGENEIVICEPRSYEDSLPISMRLRAGSSVIMNLKNLDPIEGTRLVDFVCGTAYAIDGHMVKIAESIFLFTPSQVDISETEGKQVIETEEPGSQKFFEGR